MLRLIEPRPFLRRRAAVSQTSRSASTHQHRLGFSNHDSPFTRCDWSFPHSRTPAESNQSHPLARDSVLRLTEPRSFLRRRAAVSQTSRSASTHQHRLGFSSHGSPFTRCDWCFAHSRTPAESNQSHPLARGSVLRLTEPRPGQATRNGITALQLRSNRQDSLPIEAADRTSTSGLVLRQLQNRACI